MKKIFNLVTLGLLFFILAMGCVAESAFIFAPDVKSSATHTNGDFSVSWDQVEGVDSYQYKIGDGEWVAVEGTSISFEDFADGSYTIVVKAFGEADKEGVKKESVESFITVLVDKTPPEAVSILSPSLSTNSTPTWMWGSASADTASLDVTLSKKDGETWSVVSAVSLDPSFSSFTPETALPVGIYKLEVVARDLAGNLSEVASSAESTIEADKGRSKLDSPTPYIVGHPELISGKTSITRPEWAWSRIDGVTVYRVQLVHLKDESPTPNEDLWEELREDDATGAGRVWESWKPSVELRDGSYVLLVQAWDDNDGNDWSDLDIETAQVVIDTTGPAILEFGPSVNGSTWPLVFDPETRKVEWVLSGVVMAPQFIDLTPDSVTEEVPVCTIDIAAFVGLLASEDVYTIEATAYDELENPSELAEFSFKYIEKDSGDSTNLATPTVAFIKADGSLSEERTSNSYPSFKFSVGESVPTQWEYSVDDTIWKALKRDSFTFKDRQVDGAFNIFVRYKLSGDGQVSGSGTDSITIDTTAPNRPSLDGLAVTPLRKPSWTFSSGATDLAHFRYRVGTNPWEMVVAQKDVSKTYQVPIELATSAVGVKYLFEVQAGDDLFNWSDVASFETTIRTETLGSPIVESAYSNQKTTDLTPTWTWTIPTGGNNPASAGYRYQYTIDGAALSNWVEISTSQTAFTLPAAVVNSGEDKTVTLYVQSKSVTTNNWSASGSLAITVDTEAPTTPTLTLASSSPTKETTADWTFTVTANEGVTKYAFRLNSNDGTPPTGWSEGTFDDTNKTFTTTGLIENQLNTVYLRLADDLGNWSTSGSATITVDTEAPQGLSLSCTSASKTSGGKKYTKVTSPSFDWSVGDINDVAGYQYRFDSGAGWTTVDNTTSQTITAPAQTDGPLHAEVQVRDSLGNWSASVVINDIIVDTTAPVAPTVNGLVETSDQTPEWTFRSNVSDVTQFKYKLTNITDTTTVLSWTTVSTTSGTTKTFVPSTDLTYGKRYMLEVQAGDVLDNWSTTNSFTTSVKEGALVSPVFTPMDSRTSSPIPTWTWSGGSSANYRYQLESEEGSGGWTEVTATTYTPSVDLVSVGDEGTFTLYIQAKSPSTIAWSSSASLAVTIDRKSPTVPVVTTVNPTIGMDSVDWSFTVKTGERVEKVAYRLNSDSGTPSDFDWTIVVLSSPYTINTVDLNAVIGNESTNTVYIRLADDLDNWSTSGSAVVIVDKKAPVGLTITSDESLVTHGGKNYITTQTPSFSWDVTTLSDVVAYQYQFNSGTWVTVNSNSPQIISPTGGNLAQGKVTVSVKVSDALGNWSSIVKNETLFIDSIAPSTPVVAGSATTFNPDVTWTWSITPSPVDLARYEYRLGDTGTFTSIGTATTYTATGLTVGESYVLQVKAFDHAGNESGGGSFATAIQAEIVNPPTAVTSSIGNSTNNPKPTWTWQHPNGAGATYRWQIVKGAGTPAGNGWTELSALTYTPSAELVGANAEERVTFYVQAKGMVSDVWSTSASSIVTIDRIAPAVPTVATDSPLIKENSATWTYGTSAGAIKLAYRLNSDSGSPASGSSWTIISPIPAATGNRKIDLLGLIEGENTLYVRLGDSVGNWSASGNAVVTVDTTAPSAATLSILVADLTTVGGQKYTKNKKPTFTWNSTSLNAEGVVSYKYRFGTAGAYTTQADLTVKSFVPTNNLPEGVFSVEIILLDAAGNESSATVVDDIIVDTVGPVTPTVTANIATTRNGSQGAIIWSWDSTLPADVAGYEYTLGVEPQTSWAGVAAGVKSYTPTADLACGPVGSPNSYILQVRAKDKVGNLSDNGTFEVKIGLDYVDHSQLTALIPVNASKSIFSEGVRIEWQVKTGASSYNIYKLTEAQHLATGTGTLLGNVTGSVATNGNLYHYDVAVGTGESFYYRIAGVGSSGSEGVLFASSELMKGSAISSYAGQQTVVNATDKYYISWPELTGMTGYYVFKTDTLPTAGTTWVYAGSSATLSFADNLVANTWNKDQWYRVLPVMTALIDENLTAIGDGAGYATEIAGVLGYNPLIGRATDFSTPASDFPVQVIVNLTPSQNGQIASAYIADRTNHYDKIFLTGTIEHFDASRMSAKVVRTASYGNETGVYPLAEPQGNGTTTYFTGDQLANFPVRVGEFDLPANGVISWTDPMPAYAHDGTVVSGAVHIWDYASWDREAWKYIKRKKAFDMETVKVGYEIKVVKTAKPTHTVTSATGSKGWPELGDKAFTHLAAWMREIAFNRVSRIKAPRYAWSETLGALGNGTHSYAGQEGGTTSLKISGFINKTGIGNATNYSDWTGLSVSTIGNFELAVNITDQQARVLNIGWIVTTPLYSGKARINGLKVRDYSWEWGMWGYENQGTFDIWDYNGRGTEAAPTQLTAHNFPLGSVNANGEVHGVIFTDNPYGYVEADWEGWSAVSPFSRINLYCKPEPPQQSDFQAWVNTNNRILYERQ